MLTALVAVNVFGLGPTRADDALVSELEVRIPEDAEALDEELTPDNISCGRTNRGALYGSQTLPRVGFGYEIPEPWWQRGHQYGSDRLLALIARAAAVVAESHPGGVLGVADISQEGGGAIAGHRSHQAGRDVDLIYYALDPDGEPLPPDEHMAYYSRSGRSTYARAPSFTRDIAERYFDLARNWALVKVLVTDEEAEVRHIFVSRRVRRWLIRYARRVGEPAELVARAARVLRHPHGVGSHNDHMHIRIGCSEADVNLGRCREGTARRPRRGRRWHARVACPAPMVSMP